MDVELKEYNGHPCFEATEDGNEVGEVSFRLDDSGKRMTITHVGVDPIYRGQGKAQELVMYVIGYAREHGMKITPVCSYARAIFMRHAKDLEDVTYKE